MRGYLRPRCQRHRPGARPGGRVLPGRPAAPEDRRERATIDRALLDEAVETAAREADLIVAVVGDVVQLVGETCSTATLELLGGQNALLDALADVARETGKPMVAVLVSSKPQVLPRSIRGRYQWRARRPLQRSEVRRRIHPVGAEPGHGGRTGHRRDHPRRGRTRRGRLPITFPRHAGQLPVYYNQIRGQHGNRYADLTQDPAFAFGEGLKATRRSRTASRRSSAGPPERGRHVRARPTPCTPRSPSPIRGAAQGHRGRAARTWATSSPHTAGPTANSRRSSRVTLEPGETATVVFDIPVCDCTIADADANRIVEPGEFEAAHRPLQSRRDDLKRTTFTVA